MRVIMKPSANPSQEIDLTGVLIGAVAAELWKRHGGNDVLNWMEAEQFIQGLLAGRPAAPVEPERKPRLLPKPSRPRDDSGRPIQHRPIIEPERVTGPLPLY